MDLLKKQKQLQNEGWQVIKELDLENYLSQFGKWDIGGSIITGLMTWKDIDVGIICNKLPTEDEAWRIARDLANKPYVVHITVMDNVAKYNSTFPKGYYLGLKYEKKDTPWKIDIWFAEDFGEHGNYDSWVISQLNDENRLIILTIKKVISSHPLYAKKIKSVDIYDAVLKNSVKDIEGFKMYLKEKKSIELD